MIDERELAEICRAHGIHVSLTGTVRESGAATLLDVSTRTLRRWRLDGIGPAAHRIGHAWRYALAELAAFMSVDDQRRAPDLSTVLRRCEHARPVSSCSLRRRSARA